MAFYHLHMSAIKRNAGRSVIASVAYRAGEQIHDQRQDMTFDFRRKESIHEKGIITPAGRVLDRAGFWNKIEAHHRRGDAIPAREVEVALPNKLKQANRKELVEQFATWISSTYGVGVDYAVHQSKTSKEDREGKIENWHAHLTITACSVSPYGNLGKKVEAFDAIAAKRKESKVVYALPVIREKWADFQNLHLAIAGLDERVDHRSYVDQGIDKIPTVHIGYGPKEFVEERIEINKAIREANLSIEQTKKELESIGKSVAYTEKEIDKMNRPSWAEYLSEHLENARQGQDEAIQSKAEINAQLDEFMAKSWNDYKAGIEKEIAGYKKEMDKIEKEKQAFLKHQQTVKQKHPWRYENPESIYMIKPLVDLTGSYKRNQQQIEDQNEVRSKTYDWEKRFGSPKYKYDGLTAPGYMDKQKKELRDATIKGNDWTPFFREIEARAEGRFKEPAVAQENQDMTRGKDRDDDYGY